MLYITYYGERHSARKLFSSRFVSDEHSNVTRSLHSNDRGQHVSSLLDYSTDIEQQLSKFPDTTAKNGSTRRSDKIADLSMPNKPRHWWTELVLQPDINHWYSDGEYDVPRMAEACKIRMAMYKGHLRARVGAKSC